MEEKKARYAVLRHKGRKHPYITILYTDGSSRVITVRADLKTTERLNNKIKKEIVLGIDNYAPRSVDRGITINEFIIKYLDYCSKLVQIDQLGDSTYQHDKFALQILRERIDDIKGEKVPFVSLIGKGKRNRNMPLCAEACALLDRRVKYLTEDLMQHQIMDRSKSPTQHKPLIESRRKQGYLFWEILDSNSITRAFSKARNEIGLKYFNVHALRHSFVTYCLKDDVPITTVKEFLGHRNIRTTMIYAKTDDELKAMDIKKLKPR